MLKFIGTVIIIGAIGMAIYVLIIFCLWYNSTPSANKTDRKPECNIHEKSRISFRLRDTNLDLNRLIDSFKIVHPEYENSLAITENHGHINTLLCCCIDYHKVIVFDKQPQEIYTLVFAENGRSVFIDIVSTNRNGIWHPALTSKLDSAEKQRIRLRFNNEVLARLSMVKDTLWRSRK